MVFNPNSAEGNGYVEFSCPPEICYPLVSDGEKVYPVQKLAGGSYLMQASGVPSKGYKTFTISEGNEERLSNEVSYEETIFSETSL